MKRSTLLIMIGFVFYSCQNMGKKEADNQENVSQVEEKELLKFTDIIGDTLRYDVGEPVFDIVISSDTTFQAQNIIW